MKKKIRKILVDKREYSWAVVELEWPNHILRVWRNEHKNNVFCELKFDAPRIVTPAVVEKSRKHVVAVCLHSPELCKQTYNSSLNEVGSINEQ